MNVLFIHQNFPAQYRHIAAYLSRQGGHRLVAVAKTTAGRVSGVRHVQYHIDGSPQRSLHQYVTDFETKVLHGEMVRDVLADLKGEGFTPDVVLAHPGWGEALFVRDVYPDAPRLDYCEFYYNAHGADVNFDPEQPPADDDTARIRSKNASALISLDSCDWGLSPTWWQRGQYPASYRPKISVLHDGIDTDKDEVIAVFDFGGGTFDISILEVGESVVEVKSTNGDTHLGGDDVDHVVIDWLIAEFKKDTGIDVSKDKMVLQRLRDAAEKAKIELSSVSETELNLPFITADESGPKHLSLKLSRAKLEQLVEDLLQRTIEPCKQALKDANLKAGEIDEVVLVGGSTRMPKVQQLVTELFGKEPHRGVNPDEVVAIGAAIQAGVLAGEVDDVLLLDVAPLSLGIETLGNVTTVLIPRNTTIPTRKSEVFSTASDNQPSVEIHVLQGEREMAGDNRTLGKFHLVGIPAAPRGVPQVEVTFDIDANGILDVSAKDLGTGKEQKITIQANGGLSEDEINTMMKDAESNAEADKKRRELVEAKNGAEALVHQTEKQLSEHGDKVGTEVKAEIEKASEELKKAAEGDNLEDIQAKHQALMTAAMKLGEAIYASQQEEAAETDAKADAQSSDDDVVDADFEEVDDDRKSA